MLIIVGIFIILGILETMTPHLTRKTNVFGVSIPEPLCQASSITALEEAL